MNRRPGSHSAARSPRTWRTCGFCGHSLREVKAARHGYYLPRDGLVLDVHLLYGAGGTQLDRSPHGNHGTVNGSPTNAPHPPIVLRWGGWLGVLPWQPDPRDDRGRGDRVRPQGSQIVNPALTDCSFWPTVALDRRVTAMEVIPFTPAKKPQAPAAGAETLARKLERLQVERPDIARAIEQLVDTYLTGPLHPPA